MFSIFGGGGSGASREASAHPRERKISSEWGTTDLDEQPPPTVLVARPERHEEVFVLAHLLSHMAVC